MRNTNALGRKINALGRNYLRPSNPMAHKDLSAFFALGRRIPIRGIQKGWHVPGNQCFSKVATKRFFLTQPYTQQRFSLVATNCDQAQKLRPSAGDDR